MGLPIQTPWSIVLVLATILVLLVLLPFRRCQGCQEYPPCHSPTQSPSSVKPSTVTPRHTNLQMVTDPRDDTVSHFIRTRGDWEPEMAALLQREIAPGMTVVCVGAHIGRHVLSAATAVGPSGHVYAFEANPRTYGFCLKNIALNGMEQRVTLFPMAVSDQPGVLEFQAVQGNTGQSFLGTSSQSQGRTVSLHVPVTTLDAVLGHLDRIDVLQMDVEGYEAHVLRGSATLMKKAPPLIVLEWLPSLLSRAGQSPEDLRDVLHRAGYQLETNLPNGKTKRLSKSDVKNLHSTNYDTIIARQHS